MERLGSTQAQAANTGVLPVSHAQKADAYYLPGTVVSEILEKSSSYLLSSLILHYSKGLCSLGRVGCGWHACL